MDQDCGVGGATTRRFAPAAKSAGAIRARLRERLSAARVPSDVAEVAELLVIVRAATDGDVEMAVHDQGTSGIPRLGEATPDDVGVAAWPWCRPWPLRGEPARLFRGEPARLSRSRGPGHDLLDLLPAAGSGN